MKHVRAEWHHHHPTIQTHPMLRLIVALVISTSCPWSTTTWGAARPNILVILADDLGYSDLGCYGGSIATPALDHLAANGLRFTQFYNTARCMPSRACLLSGYYAQQIRRELPLRPRPKWAALLPELLKPAGYHSYHSGKWHLDGPVLASGFEHSYLVEDQDRHFGPEEHALDDVPLPKPTLAEHYYGPTAIAQRGMEWLALHEQQHADSPFFLYLAFTVPHFPIMAPAADVARYAEQFAHGWDEERQRRLLRMTQMGLVSCALAPMEPTVLPAWNEPEAVLQRVMGRQEVAQAVPWIQLSREQQAFQAAKMAVHAAMVDVMDREIGRVVDRLRSMGVLENTFIVFMSDNGASAEQILRGAGHKAEAPVGSAETFLGIGPGWSSAANTPFRRHKCWVHEGGIATPLIVHWPQGIRARGELRHSTGHLIDLVPTFLEINQLTSPSEWQGVARPPLAGRSLVSVFAEDAPLYRDPLYFQHLDNRGLRLGEWKIVASGTDAPWELYRVASDRGERHDLANREPERVQAMAELWQRYHSQFAEQSAR